MEEFISTSLFNCINVLIYLLEFMVVVDLFFEKTKVIYKKVLGIFVFFESVIVMALYNVQMIFVIHWASWCALVIIILIYEGELKRKLLATCLLGLGVYLVERPMWICLESLLKPGDHMNIIDVICVRVSALITVMIIASILEHAFLSHKKAFIEHKWSTGESVVYGLIILACIIGSYVALLRIAGDSLPLKRVSKIVDLFYSISLLFIGVLFMSEKWFKTRQNKRLEILKKEQALNDLAFYKSYDTLRQEKKLAEEVVKNQGETLMKLAAAGKMEDIVSHSEKAIKPIAEKMVTGNDIIDVIINEQLVLAKQRGIELAVRMSVPNKLKMDTIDLCVIISQSIAYGMVLCEEKGYNKLSVNALWLKGYVIYEVLVGIIRCTDLQAEEAEVMSEDLPEHNKLAVIGEHIKAYDGKLTYGEESEYTRLKISFYAGSYEA